MKLDKELTKELLTLAGLSPTPKGKYFLVKCPECGRKEAFVYDEYIICNRKNKCGFVANVIEFLKKENLLSDKQIVKSILDNYNISADSLEKRVSSEVELPDKINYFSKEKTGFARDIAYNYLKDRGLSENIINELGYIYDNKFNRYDKTIFIPFYENKELVAFQTRDYSGLNEMRYVSQKGRDLSQFVFNIDKMEEGSDIFIFEGVFDALTLKDQIGTACLTQSLSEAQANKIWNTIPSRIIIVKDNDKAGDFGSEKTRKVLMRLKPPSINCKVYLYDTSHFGTKDFSSSGLNTLEEKYIIKSKFTNLSNLSLKGGFLKEKQWK